MSLPSQPVLDERGLLVKIYSAMMDLPNGPDRLALQGAMVDVRNRLALLLGVSEQDVQDSFEEAALIRRLAKAKH